MKIYERIFDILKTKGMSQKEFSEKTGIPQSTISDWKRKGANPVSDKIMIICDVLGVSPYELLSGTDNHKYESPDYVVITKLSGEYELIEKTRNLSEYHRGRIMGYLDAMIEASKIETEGNK